ncbi:MAG TPA: aldose 1-epimerase family protein [Pararhizobium sp.]|uniref:aldose 1-epimerase family protein n=1 Tax=Pararhizobium sp. TaxID=1977563 RepID=UPI002BEA78E3|nr:aldose 1-epimerase family protein [Pararhizobium sp.]HTO31787.1 aldose 1-epimerase family protein [Pararhizobium sp.]
MPSSIRIGNDHLTVEVSSLGAEMQSATGRDGRSWLWNGDATFWGGRSPVLFPIVGKAPEDTISIGGKTYPMAQHGFARRAEFLAAGSSPTLCRYELEASDATRAVYPFEFLLAVEHAVHGPVLTVSAEVSNRDTRPMPFGVGFHPAFRWPLPGADGRPHVVTLDNGGEPPMVRVRGGLIDPAPLPSPFRAGRLVPEASMFEADAMIFPEGADDGLCFGVEGGPELTFKFENLPNLALWTKPGASFLCIEPWHGTAALVGGSNALEARPYARTLEPGETARYAFSVEIPA